MNYQKQIELFVDYFKGAETKNKDYKIGLEFEHFILKDDLTALNYFEKDGIRSLVTELSQNQPEWEKIYAGDNLIGLKAEEKALSLEPGGQLELSISPFAKIKKIENIYLEFVKNLNEILTKRNQKLAVLGYQPKTKIKDIALLPKKRYKYMYKYFKTRGKYAHNMMKGTASIQMSIDYSDEADYSKKMRVGYFLSPLIYYFFDNSPFFEGQTAAGPSIREKIWTNCDNQRSGTIDSVFNKDFGYQDYAKYLLKTPPIIRKKDGEIIYTGNKPLTKIMDNSDLKEIEHFLSMVFPDLRTKKYIEIRTADALPYPYNFAFVILLKNIFYEQENLDYLNQKALNYNSLDFKQFKKEILENKKSSQRKELLEKTFKMAKNKATNFELTYLEKLKELYLNYNKIKFKTLNNLNLGQKEALDWCFLNN